LEDEGFKVTWLAPTPGGWIEPDAVRAALRSETLLLSLMHVNNETGVINPLAEIAAALGAHPAYFHVDAAQSFGKITAPLRDRRIDLLALSGHKLHAPKGVGALIARKRDGRRPPLEALLLGGGQELGLRPGTLPVPLIAGFGLAAELAAAEEAARTEACRAFRKTVLEGLAPLKPILNGDQTRVAAHILNLSIPGLDAEDVVEAWRGLVAISTGAACASASFTCSHVLSAMAVPAQPLAGAVRLSWCHSTETVDWAQVCAALGAERL
jgi:cysteine desulfurase